MSRGRFARNPNVHTFAACPIAIGLSLRKKDKKPIKMSEYDFQVWEIGVLAILVAGCLVRIGYLWGKGDEAINQMEKSAHRSLDRIERRLK